MRFLLLFCLLLYLTISLHQIRYVEERNATQLYLNGFNYLASIRTLLKRLSA
jgi:hypothetical protein